MGSKLFRNPQALSSALAALGTLQPRAFVFLNNLEPLDSASNYYVEQFVSINSAYLYVHKIYTYMYIESYHNCVCVNTIG